MDDSKTLYIYLETDFLGKGIMVESPSCYACSEDKKAHSLASKSQVEFKTYVMSLPDGFMKPPQAAFHYEPISKENRIDDASSKVRLMWKKSSRKVSKAGVNEKSRASQDYDSDSGSGMRAISTIKAPKSSDADSEERLLIDEGTLCWNLLIFFDIKRSEETIRFFVQHKIQRTQSNMRIPSYIGEIICTNIYPGTLPPYIHSMKVLIPLDTNDVWAFEIHDFGYSGGLVLETETRVDDASDLDQLNQESNTDLLEGLEQFGKQLDLPEGKGDELEHKEGELGDEGLKGTKSNTAAVNTKSRRKSIVSSIARHVSQGERSVGKMASMRQLPEAKMIGTCWIFVVFLVMTIVVPSVQSEFVFYQPYTDCGAASSCGNFNKLLYPFADSSHPSYCRHPGFQVHCQEGSLILMMGGRQFKVLDINREKKLVTLTRTQDICLEKLSNHTFNDGNFSVSENTVASKLLSPGAGCHPPPYLDRDTYLCNNKFLSLPDNIPDKYEGCQLIAEVLILKKSAIDFLSNKISGNEAVKRGFELSWASIDMNICLLCELTGGVCGYNASLTRFSCFCIDGTQQSNCSIPLREHEFDRPRAKTVKLRYLIAVLSVAGTFVLLGSIFIFLYRRRKSASSGDPCPEIHSEATEEANFPGIQVFQFSELAEATNSFHPNNSLGLGSYGHVFYGKLRDGREVAVKRLIGRGDQQYLYMKELDILVKLRHPNLVDLYGYVDPSSSIDPSSSTPASRPIYGSPILVYEYISNGTVAEHIHGSRARSGFLPWAIRFNIAQEIARGLVFLHASHVIHCDIKTENILLDQHFRVKICDFGISHSLLPGETHRTITARGTDGYLPPECYGYRRHCPVTNKRDVYSFGVVLMELISSQPPTDEDTNQGIDVQYLSEDAIQKITNGQLDQFVDPNLGFDTDGETREMIEEVANLGIMCLQHDRGSRPSMEDVLKELENIQNGTDEAEQIQEDSEAGTSTLNEIDSSPARQIRTY